MEPFTVHTAHAVPLRRSDVDTDQIIPSDWLKRVERTGFGAGLFAEWRQQPGFVLDRPEYAGASILVSGENFGTGSSREHAVWALQDFGFRAVISPRFGDIFRNNAHKGGLPAVQLDAADVEALMAAIEAEPATEVTVDLVGQQVRYAGRSIDFDFDVYTRDCLLAGLDGIALTLRHRDDIAAYERSRPVWMPAVAAN
ncbi:MAG: 3-isopropylmalate dehydratase small subunit [Pseudonocardiales bacterium]|nr:MAG: 3-isopropylmalate dehydratase small subunit [Pseudonocardiales bacterium]